MSRHEVVPGTLGNTGVAETAVSGRSTLGGGLMLGLPTPGGGLFLVLPTPGKPCSPPCLTAEEHLETEKVSPYFSPAQSLCASELPAVPG